MESERPWNSKTRMKLFPDGCIQQHPHMHLAAHTRGEKCTKSFTKEQWADSGNGASDPATSAPRCTATPSRSSTSQDLPWLQSRQSSVRSLGIVSPSVATQDKKLALSLCTQDEATKRPVSSFNEASLWAGRKTFTCARPQSLSDLHVAATSLLDDIGSADMCTGSCFTRLAG